MKTSENFDDKKFDMMIKSWKEEFDEANPYLDSKIISSIKNTNNNTFPIFLSKISIAAILFFGTISGYLLFSVYEKTSESTINISENSSEINQYKSEMYISELKFDEFEQLISEK